MRYLVIYFCIKTNSLSNFFVDPESLDTLHSYANAYQMPFVTPWFPTTSNVQSIKNSEKQHYTLQIRPEYHDALMDLITYYGWSNIIYIYR